MLRFLGLVPPPEFAARVVAWQDGLGHRITAPHVTVKAQMGLTDDLAWFSRVEAACRATAPFPVTLSGVRTFGSDVVYLAVDSSRVRDLHVAILEAVGDPEPGAFEGREAYVPHLTLALARAPMNGSFAEALDSARASFTTPVTFEARFVRLYCKPAPGTPYAPERDLPLGS